MNAALDGWATRRATHAVLIATSASAVAGTWVAVWFATASDTSMLTAAPLLVLVVVAGAACGAEMTRARRGELALTRLRGGHGMPLALQLLLEPLLSLLAGAASGGLIGIAMAALVREQWLADTADSRLVTAPPIIAAATTVLLILGVIATGMTRALTKPLPEQTAARERPTGSSPWMMFGQTMVLAAAAVALYQALTNPDSAAWVVYVGPAALGLLGGIVVGWIMLSVGRIATATGRERLSQSLAAGRLARTTDTGAPLLVLVAAGVVAIVSGGAAVAVDNWVDDAGRMNAGAPLTMAFDGDAAGVLAATERVDPDGNWVMAAVGVFEDDRPVSRRVFLDTARYDRVVGRFLDATPASSASRAVADLRQRSESLPVPEAIGNGVWRVGVSIAGFTRTAAIVVRLDYTTTAGRSSSTVDISLDPNTATTARSRIRDCADGCIITGISVAEGRPCTKTVSDLGECNRPTISITELAAADDDLLAEHWQLVPTDDGDDPGELQADPDTQSMTIRPARRGTSTVEPPADTSLLPVLATANTEVSSGVLIEGPGGDTRPADLVGTYEALPVVSAGGTLADLRRAQSGALPTVPGAEPFILARADTPTTVLEALRDAGASRPVTSAAVGDRIATSVNASQANVGIIVAIAGLFVGALALAAPLTRLRHDRAHDESVLRLLGVPTTIRTSAMRIELSISALLAAAGVFIFGLLGVIGFLSHSSLLDLPANQPPVEAGLGSTAVVGVLLATAAIVCVAVVAIGHLARRTKATRTHPALLRDGIAG